MIALILVLVVLGVALHLLKAYLPMDPIIVVLINVVIVIAVVYFLLTLVGLSPLALFPRLR